MRHIAPTDGNQAEIVTALREAGASVQPLHAVGGGCPDLLIGLRGVNFLIEVKDGSRSPSRRRLTPDEADWHTAWRGQVIVVTCVEDALDLLWAVLPGTTARRL